MSDTQGYFGQKGLTDDASLFHWVHFIVRQAIAEIRTAVPVKVTAVHGGGVGAPPTVDIRPLVKQMDGAGNTSSHGQIFGSNVARNQGGTSAIINDPVVGDIGLLIVPDRDISSVAANAGEANPGSFRRHDLADGIYHHAIINPTPPTQYTHYKGEGVDRVDNQGNTISTGAGGIAHLTTLASAAIKLATSGASGLISLATSGDNAPINHTTTGANSSITLSATGPGSTVSISSGGSMSLSAPGGVSMAPGTTFSAALGGDLAGTTTAALVIGASTVPAYASNAAAISGGLSVGKIYANTSIASGEQVLCVVH